ncbi:PAS domain-containing sensor histidine kinase [Neorhizobium alkalisoli]|uniref:PAS domain-containing sensor histidine kinase n=1 Tax=Neorhizobium alkalisoli TaxID=528178 RepID=UPI000CF93187|nr:PAS domain-containing sensor histidine kinase [Neorhizobium alkalisoli]
MEDLEDLYENASCGYLSLGADGVIVKVNKTLCNWLNADSYDLLGKRFHDLLSVPGKIFHETHFAPLLRMQGYFNEVALDLVSSTGEYIPVLANALERQSEDGNLLFTRVTLFQATGRRKYERELVDARRAAEKAKQDLQALNEGLARRVTEGLVERIRLQRGLLAEQEVARLREQFVAILGHDLRNPLASIVGGLNILSKESQTEKAKRVLALMSSSTERMFSLINDMLDFARLKSGAGIDVEISRTDLKPTLEQVVEEFRSSHPTRAIASDFELPSPVDCDPARIAQLVSNLMGNALTHGAGNKPIKIVACISGDELTITVRNHGVPIPKDIQDRLFQPFFRAGASSGNQGLGLGLYIASEIARSHRGYLEVRSDQEETKFTFTMPASSATPD